MGARRYHIDLRGHLAVCDANYLRLARLLPRLERADRHDLRGPLGTPQATLEVIERARYTSVVAVVQRSPAAGVAGSRFKVRLYHDARCAEVIEFQGQRLFEPEYDYPNPKMRQPDEKAQVNRFLRELLDACSTPVVAERETLID